ncbi:MAG: hypothetical protein M3255_11090 [Pseudomonadota bacterium]|nr:hypothetical protein [Pseudomonadota bacterium]
MKKSCEHSVLKYRRLAREGKRVSARDAQIPVELALVDEEGFPHQGVIGYVKPQPRSQYRHRTCAGCVPKS